eukprot:300860_1
MSDLKEPQFITRLTCIIISISINAILLSIGMYKVFYKKHPKYNMCILLLLSYLLFGIITPFYNVYYRFIIDVSQCFLSDTIEECLIVFTRLIILAFYMSRLSCAFKGTTHEINDKLLLSLFLFVMAYSIILSLNWIPQQKVTPYVTDNLGIYCSNTGDFIIICIYYGLDFIVTTFLCLLFVIKLLAVRTRRSICNEKDLQTNFNLIRLAKKTLILTTISIISSWVIMYPSMVLTSDSLLNELRWFYPLDYGINGLCIFLMFDWNIFGNTCSNCCNCCNCYNWMKYTYLSTENKDSTSPYGNLEMEVLPGITIDGSTDECTNTIHSNQSLYVLDAESRI